MPTANCIIVAQENGLRFRTEFGVIEIAPGEIAVIPRGVVFRVELIDGPARAYVCENYGRRLHAAGPRPDRRQTVSPIRAIFLPRWQPYEDAEAPHTLYVKWGGELFATEVPHSPLDVVAWHGNYYPYNTICGVSRRSARSASTTPDPSIFTVLTLAVGDARHRQHRFR